MYEKSVSNHDTSGESVVIVAATPVLSTVCATLALMSPEHLRVEPATGEVWLLHVVCPLTVRPAAMENWYDFEQSKPRTSHVLFPFVVAGLLPEMEDLFQDPYLANLPTSLIRYLTSYVETLVGAFQLSETLLGLLVSTLRPVGTDGATPTDKVGVGVGVAVGGGGQAAVLADTEADAALQVTLFAVRCAASILKS